MLATLLNQSRSTVTNLIRKTGKKIHGVGWKRDALGPAFQTNLAKAQRYLQRIKHLRAQIPAERCLILNGDGNYTNKTVLRGLPENTIYIGRGRKDMVLHHLPEPAKSPSGTTLKTGRPRRYGAKAPTPEQLRQDESHPWEKIRASAVGTHHDFKIKTLGPVLWRKSGTDLPLRIVVIAPPPSATAWPKEERCSAASPPN